ncbi:MAG: HDOD domain-containing protein [Planctomyces sp.]|nr:HDOD domain-containing protein [Planctomyces sp.]
MQRIDGRHDSTGRPQRAVPITRNDLNALLQKLEARDVNLIEFSAQLKHYPQLTRKLLQFANSAGNGKAQEITDPAVAASWLGSRRLQVMLTNLPPEWIAEEVQAA